MNEFDPMDIVFQLLKDSAKVRDGSPFAFPKRDDPRYDYRHRLQAPHTNPSLDYLKRQAALSQQSAPPMDPSWTPEAIARINAQNDKARKELSGEGGGY